VKAKMAMKSLAATTASATPSQIIKQTLQASSDDVRLNFGRSESVKRNLRRQRQRLCLTKPPSPDELETTRGDPRRFLLFDSGDQDRMRIFATDEQLRTLADATVWHIGATFSPSPTVFHQLCTIWIQLDSALVTCVYALLPNKSQAMYEAFLRVVIDECQARNLIATPERVVTDLEIAVANAVTAVFGPHVCAT
jgi:hypothetical protein